MAFTFQCPLDRPGAFGRGGTWCPPALADLPSGAVRFCESCAKFCRVLAAADSRQRGGPATVRSQLPAWLIALLCSPRRILWISSRTNSPACVSCCRGHDACPRVARRIVCLSGMVISFLPTSANTLLSDNTPQARNQAAQKRPLNSRSFKQIVGRPDRRGFWLASKFRGFSDAPLTILHPGRVGQRQ